MFMRDFDSQLLDMDDLIHFLQERKLASSKRRTSFRPQVQPKVSQVPLHRYGISPHEARMRRAAPRASKTPMTDFVLENLGPQQLKVLDTESLQALALALLKKGDLERAREVLYQASLMNPESDTLATRLGETIHRAGELSAAMRK
jgi:hypothetical protein